jgi:hypothetical protein
VNRVLLWWTAWDRADYGSVLWIYHPDTDSWEKDPMFNPNGLQPLGSSFAFDPVHNVAILMGSTDNSGEFGHGEIDNLFLYRYGSGNPTTSSTPPTAPIITPPSSPPPTAYHTLPVTSTLEAMYLGTDQDKVGPIDQTTPNGISDFHISLSGLRSTPMRVRITSDTGGIWETPFNGFNWIIATQYNGAAGDFWFEPFNSKTFHVKVTYSDGTTDEADASSPTVVPTPPGSASSVVQTPPSASTLKAAYLGQDQDKVGRINRTTPDGIPDFHISASGLRSTPTRVRITSDTGGIWETPFNGFNWIIATRYNGTAGDFWFEPFNSNTFHVEVTYADGTTDGADASSPSAPVTSTLKAVYLGKDQDKVGRINRTKPDGIPDFHISVSGLRSTPTRARITSDTGGIWETPFNGFNWIIATRYNGTAGDFWFEPFNSNTFHVEVTYADGTTDGADATPNSRQPRSR